MIPFVKSICALAVFTVLSALLMPSASVAQVAGQNVNMVSGTQWPTGDPFLQRQNEPSMAVSTRNPMHILAGSNDYRSVDLELVLSGGAETGDSWLGLFKSFDGGLTWQSTLLPGCPQAVPQCTDSGALGGRYQAASDPVVRAGTNGMFYYAGLAFDRATSSTTASSFSSIFVARYNDLNNNENVDPITYIDTHIVATGNSSQFLDKPAMAVDTPRSGAMTCSFNANEPGTGPNGGTLTVHQSFPAGNIYLTYTDFLTATKDNTTPTHLMFTRSADCGVTWSSPIQINSGTTTSQGSAIAVNPLNGNVYVAWRQFASTGVPDAIMIAQSTNGETSFGAPVRISTFQPFDQGTTGTSFRTNAYPAITTDFLGLVYVAFSARGLTASGDARVVFAGSIDGAHWTPAIMVDNPSLNAQSNPSGRGHQIMPAMTFANGRLTILYYDLRLDHYGAFYTPNATSPTGYAQTLLPEGELAPPSPVSSEVFTNFIDDNGLTLRRHTLDLRVLELGIFPTVTLGPSVLVSQYAYGCCVNPNAPDIEQFKFNVPNLPLFSTGEVPFLGDYIEVVPSPLFVPNGSSWSYNFTPSVNPLFHASWTDNRDVVPPADGNWQNYTPAVPIGTTSVFQSGSSVASCKPGQEGMRNQNIYTSQITGGLVVGAPGNAKQLGTTTFNNMTFPFQRAFAVEAQNVTNKPLNVRFTIANQPTGGSASFLQFSPLTTLDLTIPAFSSVSRSVFVTSSNPQARVTVNVAQINAIGGSVVTNGLSSSAVLNPDITNPNITNPNITNPNITNPNITNFEVTNPNITNPNITNPNITNPNITNPNITNPNITNPNITNVSATNPNITNPNITNPDITNPNITNPNITNPDITNGSIQDVIYPMSNNGNTTATYTVKTATFAPPPGGVFLQLILNKLYETPAANNCQLANETHWVTVANITNPKLYTPTDPQLGNPNITNPTPNEASVTLAPGETVYITLRVVNPTPAITPFNPLTSITPVTIPQAVNTQTVLSNPGATIFPPVTVPPLMITTATLLDGILGNSYSARIAVQGGNPGADTWSVSVGALPTGLSLNTATGAISGPLSATGTFTFTIQVKDTAIGTQFPQHTTSQSYTIHVVPPLSLASATLPGGTQGTFYSQAIVPAGGLSPVTISLIGGALPASLNFNNGTITGTPTGTGTSNFTVRAVDRSNPQQVFTQSYSINIVMPVHTVGNIFFITSPVNSVGGHVLSNSPITVRVTDNQEAVVPGAPVTISFNGTPPCSTAVLSGTLTQVTDQTGQASFNDLKIDRGQQAYTLKATVSSAPNVFGTSVAFNVEGFCDTSSLTVAREYHRAVSLPNGKVLVAGGASNLDGTGALMSAEIYDPATHTFASIGNMHDPRVDFTATLLSNGKVLIAGGFNDTTSLASAEIFDPADNSFTLLPSAMTSPRSEHTATLLQDGTVLIAGGDSVNNATTLTTVGTAEIFHPTTNSFSNTELGMNTPRADHHADLLPNGQVLITGGFDAHLTLLASAELYDPVTLTFVPTGSMATARLFHASALLNTGKVLVAGGQITSGGATTATAELYDPSAGTFSSTGSMAQPRARYFDTVLPNGLVLIEGVGGGTTAYAELYDPATGTFGAGGDLTSNNGGGREALLPDGSVVIAGGFNGPNVLANAEIFYPLSNLGFTPRTFTSSASFFAALGSIPSTTETYETLANGSVILQGATVDSLTYSSFPAGVDGLINGSFASIGTQSLTARRGGSPSFFLQGDSITVTFPVPVIASGIFFNAYTSVPGSYCLSTAVGTACNGSTYDTSSFYFVGLISSTPFTSVTIKGTGSGASGYNVDNLTYVPVP